MSTQTQESFIQSVTGSETILTDIGFLHHSTERKGYATYIDYKRDDTLISFMLGPSDWNVEISIFTNNRKYAFKDLLEIPSIAQWPASNKFEQTSKDRINDEVIWFMKFIRFSLTEIFSKS